MVAVELELFQLTFKAARIHANVEQRADKHIASDAADQVEIECFHFVVAAFVRTRQNLVSRALMSAATKRVNLARGISRAKAIVYVHHGQAAGATV